MTQRNLVVIGLWLVGVLGCGSSKGPGDAGPDASYLLPPNPLSPLAACMELAAAQASFEVNCGRLAQSDVGDSSSGYIGAECAPTLLAAEEAAFKAGSLAYSGAAVSCMVNDLLTASGSATITCNVGYPELDPECGQLAWGTLGPGERCNDQYACGQGLYCPSGCGVCTVDVGLTGSCGTANQGAFCSDGACNGEVCQPILGVTQGCEMSAICRPPLTCHADGCQNPLGVDGGCNDTGDCIDGLSCNAFSSRCFPAPEDDGDCSAQPCAMDYACSASDAGFACVRLTAGGPCVVTDGGPQCLEFESCRDGGCVELSSLDGGCGVSADCARGACSGGTCQLLSDGSPCTTSSECQSGTCDTAASETCIASCQ